MSAAASLVEETGASEAGRLVALAAHEIRTPLGGVLALADLILAEDLPEAARGHADALKAAAEHLMRVASSLIGGAVSAGPATVDLDRFLARVAGPLAARAALKGLDFHASRGPGAPRCVLVEEAALRRIVDNLADNALRATERGAVALAIELVARDSEHALLRVAVRDSGPGLGAAPERLFAPHVQGDGPTGAAGLGLAVVADLAAALGGRVEARNLAAGGAEVSAHVRLRTLDGESEREGAIRVLVAEDNAVNQRVVSTLLNHFGHQYDVVADGAAAVAAAAGGAYDLVLMDARMPTLNGLAATRAIRAMDGRAGEVRVVGLTAHAFDEEVNAFLAAGADAVVTKPISVAELWRAIDARESGRRA